MKKMRFLIFNFFFSVSILVAMEKEMGVTVKDSSPRILSNEEQAELLKVVEERIQSIRENSSIDKEQYLQDVLKQLTRINEEKKGALTSNLIFPHKTL